MAEKQQGHEMTEYEEGYSDGIMDGTAAVNLLEGRLARLTEEHAATISRLTAALQTIADGDEPRPLGKRYRSDGEPSKHDKCTHGQWMWEDCGSCVSEFARAALATSSDTDAEQGGGRG